MIDMSLDLLLFSVCGVHFGVEAGQINGVSSYIGERSEDIFWFHEEFEYGAGVKKYFSPTVISIKTADSKPYRLIIDSMEDIAGFSQSDIRLFPPLLEPLAMQKGFWGIIIRNGVMVLLIDFQIFLNRKLKN
jgi:hypothetical protein